MINILGHHARSCFFGLALLSCAALSRPLDGCASGRGGQGGGGKAQASPAAQEQGRPEEKGSRTEAQKKINSQLLYALYELRGEAAAKGVPAEGSGVKTDEDGRVLIDIRAKVSKELLGRVEELGGKVVSSSERHNSIVTRFPLAKLETLAAEKSVRFIEPAAEATTN